MTAQDSLWLPGQLPGLNEIIDAAKGYGGRGAGYALLKRKWTEYVWAHAKAARLPARPGPVMLLFDWHEPNRRRDPDNVAAGGRKFILDGLVKAGVLAGDGWAHVAGWSDHWILNPQKAGVLVSIQFALTSPAAR